MPGFKIGRYHHLREPMDPDDPDRSTRPDDEAILRDFVVRHFPDAAGPTIMLKACIFTNSPDEHFLIDLLPDAPQVSVAAGFSGHGYKFCSLVGEVMADLAIGWDGRATTSACSAWTDSPADPLELDAGSRAEIDGHRRSVAHWLRARFTQLLDDGVDAGNEELANRLRRVPHVYSRYRAVARVPCD